jgi:DNA-binding SARP family transcriptional activator
MEVLPGGAGPSDKRLVIRLLGPLAIEDGERRLGPGDLGGVRPKQVLQILLAARGHRVPVDRLAQFIWGDEPPQNVAGSLQTFVSVLRRHLTPDREQARRLVVTETEAYRFATELVALDLDRFDELLERSAREATRLARASLEQALELVGGEVMEDEPYATWAVDVRGSYQGRVLGARLDAADAALAERDFAAALAHAEAAAAVDRFSERAHRLQMLALYALGRQHEALGRYRSFRSLLDEELGLEPAAETRALEAAVIRQHDVHILLPRAIRPAPVNGAGRPLRLLGRTAELEQLTDAVRRALAGDLALVQVDGEAGLGKTRLLDELERELDDVRVGRAACSELEQHLPYVPLAAALRRALAGIELDGRSLPALGRILPELRLGADSQTFDEVETLEALVALAAEHAPFALLLDDLHRADPWTVAALGYLRRRGAGLRVAIVTTARHGEEPEDHPLGRLAPDMLLRLGPLSASELTPLGVPGLHETTGGNPRFVTEALANGHRPECSHTLADALLAQCRAEGERAYRVLAAASVLEQPFDPEPLAALLGVDPAELLEELERLCGRRLLRVDGLRFRFRYDLVRQVLLESVSPARRRLLLQRLARPAAHGAAADVARTG